MALFNITSAKNPAIGNRNRFHMVSNENMTVDTIDNTELTISQLEITEEQWLGNEI